MSSVSAFSVVLSFTGAAQVGVSGAEEDRHRMPASLVRVIQTFDDGNDAFQGPFGVCIGPNGHVFVTDDLGHRVIEFGRTGVHVRALGSKGHGPGQLAWPDAVAFDRRGSFYIADTGSHRIQVWRADGAFLREFGRLRLNPPGRPLANPRDVLVTEDNRVFVADFNGNCVQEYDLSGHCVQRIGSQGSGLGELAGPIQLALSREGDLYVSELHNHRIQAFDSTGRAIALIGEQGDGDGMFSSPHGLAIGPDSELYVADYGNDRIQALTTDGEFVGTVALPTGTVLKKPTDLCFDQDGLLHVVDKGNHRLLVLRLEH